MKSSLKEIEFPKELKKSSGFIINNFIDKYYLGWLIRFIYNPIVFFKRYFLGLKLIPMVVLNKITVIK